MLTVPNATTNTKSPVLDALKVQVVPAAEHDPVRETIAPAGIENRRKSATFPKHFICLRRHTL